MPTASKGEPRSERQVTAFLAFAGVLMAFGIDAALPAFGALRATFDLDARGISPAIVGTAYFMGIGVGQLGCGLLADRFGRRNVLAVGFVLYGLGALASALAPSLALLLVARFAWGMAASAPSVLRFAIARDLYAGDRMARVVSTFTAVFLLGPILVPFAGQGILLVGTWRTVFAAGAIMASIATVWTFRFGETMAQAHRRTMQFAPFAEAFRVVVRTPRTRWAIIGSTLFNGAFFIWLGSAQPILDQVYDRDRQFTLFFGLSGAGMALTLLANNRMIDRYGTHRMIRVASSAHVLLTLPALAWTPRSGGIPNVWVWFAWAAVANALMIVISPMASAVAMEPMADKAGVASAVMGVSQLGIGAGLAAVVDAQIDATVTPMLVGAVLLGALGWAALLLATRPEAKASSAKADGARAQSPMGSSTMPNHT